MIKPTGNSFINLSLFFHILPLISNCRLLPDTSSLFQMVDFLVDQIVNWFINHTYLERREQISWNHHKEENPCPNTHTHTHIVIALVSDILLIKCQCSLENSSRIIVVYLKWQLEIVGTRTEFDGGKYSALSQTLGGKRPKTKQKLAKKNSTRYQTCHYFSMISQNKKKYIQCKEDPKQFSAKISAVMSFKIQVT